MVYNIFLVKKYRNVIENGGSKHDTLEFDNKITHEMSILMGIEIIMDFVK